MLEVQRAAPSLRVKICNASVSIKVQFQGAPRISRRRTRAAGAVTRGTPESAVVASPIYKEPSQITRHRSDILSVALCT